MSSQRIVPTNALPPKTISPLEPGASNVFESAAIKSTNQNILQAKLGGNQNGGIRRRNKRLRGGATGVASNASPVVVVAGATSYDPNPSATNANNTQISGLANMVSSQSALDVTVGGTQAQAAAISAKQDAVYNGKGGSRRRKSHKKGGALSIWSCLSGGKKSRRHHKSCRCKNRKTRKHTKRHRH